MNILPQKSWHVRTKKNIERVRRDEEKAAEEEKERQRRIALAEQEARTELLRSKARKRNADGELEGEQSSSKRPIEETSSGSSSTKSVEIYTNTGHINFFRENFFREAESGEKSSGKNAENEAEKKAEKEKWEKDIGLLTYLGQSSVESRETPPWYLNKMEKSRPVIDPQVKDEKLKKSLDPLNQMKAYVEKTEKHRHGHDGKDKHSGHKHKKKKKNKDKDKEKDRKPSSSSKTIDQLRAERLKREQEERKRTQEHLGGKVKGHEKSCVYEEPVDERRRGYNSVFNPDFVRKPKDKTRPRDYYD